MQTPHWWQALETLLHGKQPRLMIMGGVGCFLLLSMLAMVGERGYFEVYEFTRYLGRVEQRMRTLEAENQRMQHQVSSLRSDAYQVEKLAREDLGLARPDELIFQIVNRPRGSQSDKGIPLP